MHEIDALNESPPPGCRLDDNTVGRLLVAYQPPAAERAFKLPNGRPEMISEAW